MTKLITGAELYEYEGKEYPEYLRQWNASTWIQPFALYYCQGHGVDIGAGRSPLPGAIPIDKLNGCDAMSFPADKGSLDYIFSSHCLEHLDDPNDALKYWRTKLKTGGVLFLYLPHPDMHYWHPRNNKKHKNIWYPIEACAMVSYAGYELIDHSERDLYWSFSIVGIKK